MSGTVPFAPGFSASFGIPIDAFRLNIYNAALRFCGNTRLASLTETNEARFLLDDAWNDGAVQDMLEQGLWNFARRTSQLDADPLLTPNFGYMYAFEKPADWVRTMAVCTDPWFRQPLTRVSDESGYLFSDLKTIFFAYVSNDPNYGNAFSRWPQTYYRAVSAHLAELIVWKLTTDKSKVEMVVKEAHKLLKDARSKNAMNESAQFLPMGTWTRARIGNRSRFDNGTGGLGGQGGDFNSDFNSDF